jgi:adenylate cyclase
MPKEIEKKFLVDIEKWNRQGKKEHLIQGYLSTQKERVVRIRLAGNQAFITIKGEKQGISRDEYEYSIPLEDAQRILYDLCERPLIEKYRYQIEYHGQIWIVDEFLGVNQGLIVAEIELETETQEIYFPDWVGTEVTDDHKYSNAYLVRHPYSDW